LAINFCFFGKKTPYGKIFQNSVPKVLTSSPINVVVFKFCEIWKLTKSCVVYWTKKQNFTCHSNCHYFADHVQNLPGSAPNNVLRVLQMSSKSVHFWQSYSRMCRTPAKSCPKVNTIFGGSLATCRITGCSKNRKLIQYYSACCHRVK